MFLSLAFRTPSERAAWVRRTLSRAKCIDHFLSIFITAAHISLTQRPVVPSLGLYETKTMPGELMYVASTSIEIRLIGINQLSISGSNLSGVGEAAKKATIYI